MRSRAKTALIATLAITLVILATVLPSYITAQTTTTKLPVTAYSFTKPYDALVYLIGNEAIAIDKQGKIIAGPSTNDTAVIQAAIDHGNTIVVTHGVYNLSAPIRITKDNVTINFMYSTLKASADVGAEAMIYVKDASHIKIMNVILDANHIARRTLMIHAYTKDIEDIVIENVETENTITGYIWPGLNIGAEYPYHVKNVIVRNCYIHDHPEATYDDVSFGRVINLVIENCIFENLGKNVLFYGGEDHKIINNKFINVPIINIQSENSLFADNFVKRTSGRTGIYVNPFTADGAADARDTYYVTITNNRLVNASIQVNSGTHYIIISGNIIRFDPPDTSSDSNGIVITTDNVKVQGNIITGCGRAGVYLAGANYVDIIGNTIVDVGQNTALAVRGGVIDFDSTNPSNYVNVYMNNIVGKTITIAYGILCRGNYWDIKDNSVINTTIPTKVYGLLISNSGKAIFSGDGVTTTFVIPHGLVSTPTNVVVTPGSADAAGQFYVTANATDIIVTYATAPPNGTNNVVLYWRASVNG